MNQALRTRAARTFESDDQDHPILFRFYQAPCYLELSPQLFHQESPYRFPDKDAPYLRGNAKGVESFLLLHTVF